MLQAPALNWPKKIRLEIPCHHHQYPLLFSASETQQKRNRKRGNLINRILTSNLFYHQHQISSEGLEEKNNAALKPGKRFLLEGCTGAPQHACCLLSMNKMTSQHLNGARVTSQSLTLRLPLLSVPLDKAHTLSTVFSAEASSLFAAHEYLFVLADFITW